RRICENRLSGGSALRIKTGDTHLLKKRIHRRWHGRARLIVATLVLTLLSTAWIGNPTAKATIGLQQQDNRLPQQTTPPAKGDEENKKPKSTTPSDPVFVASTDDYYIGPTDKLMIKIEDAEELSGEKEVYASGYIELPIVGRLLVLNKTPEQVAALI